MLDKLTAPAEETAQEGAFSQARIYSRYIALQIDAIEHGRLAKNIETRD
jgi:hypothetical protein